MEIGESKENGDQGDQVRRVQICGKYWEITKSSQTAKMLKINEENRHKDGKKTVTKEGTTEA